MKLFFDGKQKRSNIRRTATAEGEKSTEGKEVSAREKLERSRTAFH